MKRLITCVVCVLLVSVLLAGCSDDDDDNSGRSIDGSSVIEGSSVEEILNNLDENGKLQSGRGYVFTGEITADTLKRVLQAVPDGDVNPVTLDFSRCMGSNIRLKDRAGENLPLDAAIKRIVFPAGLTRVPDNFAYDCDFAYHYNKLGSHVMLESVVILNGTTRIGGDAFMGCSSLTSITIPNSVTAIVESAFRGCSALQSITIPDGVTSIGGYAFDSCSTLQSIDIPSSVTSIGQCAFAVWKNTQTIIVHWGASDTKPAGWDRHWCEVCRAKVINADNNKVLDIDRNTGLARN